MYDIQNSASPFLEARRAMEAPDRTDQNQRFVQRTMPDSETAFREIVQNAYAEMDKGDLAALGLSPIPLVGDAAGVINDVRNFATGRQEITPANVALSALGVVPIIPSPVQVRRIVRRAPESLEQSHSAIESAYLAGKGKKSVRELSADELAELERTTGAFRGTDGIVRQEINDVGMQFTPQYEQKRNIYNQLPATQNAKEIVRWDESKQDFVKKFVPTELSDIVTGIPDEIRSIDAVRDVKLRKLPDEIRKTGTRAQAGTLRYPDGATAPYIALPEATARTQMESVKHELQHVVQDAQGLSRGSSVRAQLPPGITMDTATKAQKELAAAKYNATPGEIEARVTQARGTWTQEQREQIPFSSMYKVAEEDAMRYLADVMKAQSRTGAK